MRSLAGRRAHGQGWILTTAAITATSVFVSLFVIVGADSYWLVALGDRMWQTGEVPVGLPFAAADSADWPNVIVLAELVFSGLHRLGTFGLPYAQVLADVLALALLSLAARRAGASDRAVASVLALVVIGTLPSLVVVRVQLFSLPMFATLLLLLYTDEQRPSRRIWAVPVLIALWSNLHGAALTGLVVTGCYLIFSRLRLRPLETVAVGVITLVAPLATPAGLRTLGYYTGVLDNEAAARGTELWARPSLSSPFDLLMLACAAGVLCLSLRRRRRVWEYVVLGGLACGTAFAARHGVWLLMAAAVPASLGLRVGLSMHTRPEGASWRRSAGLVCLATALAVPAVALRGENTLPANQQLVEAVAVAAGGKVVLAPEPLVESLAVEGVRVWASDPIDAFSRDDQKAYLDFLEGSGPHAAAALAAADMVVVPSSSAQARLVESVGAFRVQKGAPHGWLFYERTPL